ncbi:MAG: hypothetical protein AAFV96_03095, partial [Pseudomonadota bacterium]
MTIASQDLKPGIDAAIAALAPRFGDRLATGEAIRAEHGRDEAHHTHRLPDAVVWPESTDEVAEVARLCNVHILRMHGQHLVHPAHIEADAAAHG